MNVILYLGAAIIDIITHINKIITSNHEVEQKETFTSQS